jgi:predicted methyltransferase
MKSYVRNTINLSWDKILLTSVICKLRENIWSSRFCFKLYDIKNEKEGEEEVVVEEEVVEEEVVEKGSFQIRKFWTKVMQKYSC